MRKVAVIVLVIMASVVLVASTLAESATKEECIAKCKEAAQLIAEKGMDAAFQDLQNKDGKFVWKDSYVAVFDFTGTHLTHPLRPAAVGKNVIGLKDSNGKLFVKELIEVAKTNGEGWTEYMYPKPEELAKPTPFNEKISSKKLTYVYRVPGKDLIVVAGFFE